MKSSVSMSDRSKGGGDLPSQLSHTKVKGFHPYLDKVNEGGDQRTNPDGSDIYELKSFTIRISEPPNGEDASDPAKVQRLAREILKHKDQEKEHFYILILNGKNRLKSAKHISTGTLTSSLVHPREVYRPALIDGAAGIIAFHNHPSGDPSPSQEDVEITDRLQDVGELVGIPLLDHVIISELDNSYRSFQEMGLI